MPFAVAHLLLRSRFGRLTVMNSTLADNTAQGGKANGEGSPALRLTIEVL